MAFGRGFGQGAGRGLCRRRGFCWNSFSEPEPLNKVAQKELLEAELKRIEAEKTEIQKRLTSLE
jgi:hypothetical protein